MCISVIDDLEAHGDFVGLYKVEYIASDVLVTILKDVLLRHNLKITNCHGQCYDRASNMSGRSGVAIQFLAEEPQALYTHCYSHVINFSCWRRTEAA